MASKVAQIKKDTFTINDKEYMGLDVDFNMVCNMQEMGFDPMEHGDKPLPFARAYFAICSELYDLNEAGTEIARHLAKGGKLDALIDVFTRKVHESDFFRQAEETTEENAQPSEAAEETE